MSTLQYAGYLDRMPVMDDLAAKIRALRESLGLAQDEVGDALGIGRERYNKMENRKVGFSDATLEKLAPILLSNKETLMAWKAIDQFGSEALKIACQYLEHSSAIGAKSALEDIEAEINSRKRK